jgi:DNA modification methylase
MIDHIDPNAYDAVVLDESSILKAMDGKTRNKLVKLFRYVPYRLACTATPSPNDQIELGNHAEFLGVCTSNEMLAMFFIHANKQHEDIVRGMKIRKKMPSNQGQEWRLKNHARKSFYQWLSSWAISMKKPSDLGYSDKGFILPKLNIIPEFVESKITTDGSLFFTGLKGIASRADIRKKTLPDRVSKCIDLLSKNDDQWIVWCGLDSESHAIKQLTKDDNAIEVCGSNTPEYKSQSFEDFQHSKYRILITKPKIGGFGMNFQNSHNMIFLGINDSWEQYYQCIRREYRFGQKYPVNVHVVLSNAEQEILDNIIRKERMAINLHNELIIEVRNYERQEIKGEVLKMETVNTTTVYGKNFKIINGDSCIELPNIESNSIDLSVYSPPFADLYTYTALPNDLGNSRGWDEFFSHYAFIIREIYRVTKAGRISCVHTSDIPAMAIKDGYIGVRDFPGKVIEAHEKEGWIFHGRAIVPKNPQAQAIRTHSKGLLFVQLKRDSTDSRPCLLDHILMFKKPGIPDTKVNPVANGEIDNEKWIDWASGIWSGINESDVLKYQQAKTGDDEKHVCPLQLGTIERCIKLYSNPDETVLTPFLGIGSEAYQALRFGRKAVGIELKESYFNIASKNLRDAEVDAQPLLFNASI